MLVTQDPRRSWGARSLFVSSIGARRSRDKSRFRGPRSARQEPHGGRVAAMCLRPVRFRRGELRRIWPSLDRYCRLTLYLGIDRCSDKNDDHRNPEPNHKADYGSQRAVSFVASGKIGRIPEEEDGRDRACLDSRRRTLSSVRYIPRPYSPITLAILPAPFSSVKRLSICAHAVSGRSAGAARGEVAPPHIGKQRRHHRRVPGPQGHRHVTA